MSDADLVYERSGRYGRLTFTDCNGQTATFKETPWQWGSPGAEEAVLALRVSVGTTGRVYLTQSDATALLPFLTHFALHGALRDAAEHSARQEAESTEEEAQ